MKEFIDKLIGRLEEERNTAYNTYKLFEIKVDLGRGFGLEKSIEIVNELAEEYERETDQTDYANIELYAFWKKHQWIPCSERLPKKKTWVLVTRKSGVVDIEMLSTKGWISKIDEVIAWMPLPAPYTEGE